MASQSSPDARSLQSPDQPIQTPATIANIGPRKRGRPPGPAKGKDKQTPAATAAKGRGKDKGKGKGKGKGVVAEEEGTGMQVEVEVDEELDLGPDTITPSNPSSAILQQLASSPTPSLPQKAKRGRKPKQPQVESPLLYQSSLSPSDNVAISSTGKKNAVRQSKIVDHLRAVKKSASPSPSLQSKKSSSNSANNAMSRTPTPSLDEVMSSSGSKPRKRDAVKGKAKEQQLSGVFRPSENVDVGGGDNIMNREKEELLKKLSQFG